MVTSTLLLQVALSLLALVGIASIVLLIVIALRRASRKRRSLPNVHAPPLYLLSQLARFLFSRETNKIVFETLRADIAHEYCQALQNNQSAKAIWILLKGNGIFLANLLRQISDPIYDLLDRKKNKKTVD